MRIGFFGGSFDPPHRGHVALARLAMDRLALDRVLFAPVGRQPLKRDRPQASFEDRMAMTALAIRGEPGFEASDLDGPRKDGRPNYSIDAIRALRGAVRSEDEIVCLMGADSFLTIGHWYRAADLLLGCDFAVASRPGFDLGRIAAALPDAIAVAAADEAAAGVLSLWLSEGGQKRSRLYLLSELADETSATGIRMEIQRGEAPRMVLDPAVAAYIRERGLYREGRAG